MGLLGWGLGSEANIVPGKNVIPHRSFVKGKLRYHIDRFWYQATMPYTSWNILGVEEVTMRAKRCTRCGAIFASNANQHHRTKKCQAGKGVEYDDFDVLAWVRKTKFCTANVNVHLILTDTPSNECTRELRVVLRPCGSYVNIESEIMVADNVKSTDLLRVITSSIKDGQGDTTVQQLRCTLDKYATAFCGGRKALPDWLWRRFSTNAFKDKALLEVAIEYGFDPVEQCNILREFRDPEIEAFTRQLYLSGKYTTLRHERLHKFVEDLRWNKVSAESRMAAYEKLGAFECGVVEASIPMAYEARFSHDPSVRERMNMEVAKGIIRDM